MSTACILIGLLFVLTGIITKKNPYKINNYNEIPKEEKKLIKIRNLKKGYSISFYLSGVILIIYAGITTLVDLSKWDLWVISSICICTAISINIVEIKFNRSEYNRVYKIINIILLDILLIALPSVLIYGRKENNVILSEDKIEIHGLYAQNINIDEIDSIFYVSSIPKVLIRSNGYSDGLIQKGNFRLSKWGKCKLYIHNSNNPKIVIMHGKGTTLLNLYDECESYDLYNRISKWYTEYLKDIAKN